MTIYGQCMSVSPFSFHPIWLSLLPQCTLLANAHTRLHKYTITYIDMHSTFERANNCPMQVASICPQPVLFFSLFFVFVVVVWHLCCCRYNTICTHKLKSLHNTTLLLVAQNGWYEHMYNDGDEHDWYIFSSNRKKKHYGNKIRCAVVAAVNQKEMFSFFLFLYILSYCWHRCIVAIVVSNNNILSGNVTVSVYE